MQTDEQGYILRHRSSFRGQHQQHASSKMNYYVQDHTNGDNGTDDFMSSGPYHSMPHAMNPGNSSSDSDYMENEFEMKSNGGSTGNLHRNRMTTKFSSKRKKKTTTGQSDTSSSNYGGNNAAFDDSEWIQCKESDTGRLIWYNRDTLMVTFENPILNNLHRGRNDSILKESIAREDIDDNLIPKYLLKFGQQQWDFKNDYVDVFRAQSARIDHTELLPHPNDLVFPEFFSNHTIPKKESFVATILPPIDFNITNASWKMAINVNKTTASDIIEKFVAKINFNKKDENYFPQQFVLKVIGNEEYILFDHKKLIIDYEAVRRAVRNEDDVTFGLVHRPDLHQIIQDAKELQDDYKESFDTKYPPKVRDYYFLKYEKYGNGDGKSLIELKLDLVQKQADELKRKQTAQINNINNNHHNKPPPNNNGSTTTTFIYGMGTPTNGYHQVSYSDNSFTTSYTAAPPSPTPIQESTTPISTFNNQQNNYNNNHNHNNHNNHGRTSHHTQSKTYTLSEIAPPSSPNFTSSISSNSNNSGTTPNHQHQHQHQQQQHKNNMRKSKSAKALPMDPPNKSPKKLPRTPKNKQLPPNGPLTPSHSGHPNNNSGPGPFNINTNMMNNGFGLQTAGNLQQRDISQLHINGKSTIIGPGPNNNGYNGNNNNNRTVWHHMNNNGSAPSTPTSQSRDAPPSPRSGWTQSRGMKMNNNGNNRSSQGQQQQRYSANHYSMPQQGARNFMKSGSRSTGNIHKVSNSSDYDSVNGKPSSPAPHRMSVSDHRTLHRRINSMSGSVKLGRHAASSGSSSSNVSPYGSEPSLRDSAWLRNEIKSRNNNGNHNTILLEDHHQLYRFRVSNLTNVTKLPRYIDMEHRIRRVIVKHELWMGPLSYKQCEYSTPNIARVSDNMKFADWFTAKNLKYSDLPREATISCTIYGLSEHEKKKNTVVTTPLAYVRLPIIDHRHRLINGKYILNAWPIPVFVKTKHGLKSDPYSHGEEFRFRGAIRDRYIGRNSHKKNKNKHDDGHGHGHDDKHGHEHDHHKDKDKPIKQSSILDHFNKLEHDICQVTIEFTRRDFDVVAPLISIGQTMSSKHTKGGGAAAYTKTWVSKNGGNLSAKELKKKEKKRNKKNSKKDQKRDKNGLTDDDWTRIHNIITRDLIHEISDEEKDIMWIARDQLVHMPEALPTFLKCVDWRDKYFRAETYQYLREWQPPTHLEDALELLGFEFCDTRVREYGVMCIANMHDSDLQRYLLQLVQCLKFELQHNNSLIRLLMRRALMNPYQIGHFLFWHLKSEYHNLEYCERFGLYMEEYLLHSTTHARELLQQSNLIDALTYINKKIYIGKNNKEQKKDKQQLLQELHEMIEQLNRQMPTIISLPLNPRWRCTHLIVEKCKFFSSAQVPLLLVFKNVDPLAQDIHVLYKSGDDLRQDILTLQVFRVMDKVWLDRGLNLRLITYDVVATGNECGMLQIVLNSKTTNHVHVTEGGGPQKGCRDETTHLKWLKKYNPNQSHLDTARYNYARSAAGYCVATYTLGIGDRHPDNIMLKKNGVIFHIDFGHFLGNFKSKKLVGNYSWRRERTPFVFLPAMKYCMDLGGKDHDLYNDFEQWFEDAYMALRIRHRLLFNLFTLMIPSVMPELICKNDLTYLKEQLHLNDIPQDKIGKHCKKVIKQCLNDKSRILDNIFHAVKHG